ncbi:MAG: hypothetical protein VB055_03465 [Oscillospiraceae bacterium]|nr:hypothetical protein [Oscillospiraceae bacterium]
MTLSMPPGGIERRTYSYLFGMAEQLNLALSQLETGTAAVQTAVGQTAGKTELRQQVQSLKALVVKTATIVRSELETLSASLSGTYLAQADFGSYVQQLSAQLEANPANITQYYKFASDLQANMDAVDTAFQRYRTEAEGYIRTGIVSYDGETPVYGVAVGQGLVTTTVTDGSGNETVKVDPNQFRSTFTASRLSFWQYDVEVAYVSNRQLYIKEATIADRLTVGKWIVSTGSGLAVKWGG